MDANTLWRFDDAYEAELSTMVAEYHGGVSTQPWPLLPAAAVKQLWLEFSNTGTVLNEQQLDEFRTLTLRNIARLYINTVIAGHTEQDPALFLQDTGIADIDGFISWAIDTAEGPWRISDYGLPKLQQISYKLYEAETVGRKIMYLDAILNVAHQRSDLAGLFIEGGTATLVELAAN